MNLSKLFETQKKLDDRIVKEKGLEEQDLLDKKILALQVELGELANEWQMFKFWKENPEPRTKLFKIKDIMGKEEVFNFNPNEVQNGFFSKVKEFNPLLEEYVDCFHFILSIGNDLEIELIDVEAAHFKTIEESFIQMFREVSMLKTDITVGIEEEINCSYEELFGLFIGLGSQLGFTTDQIEQAYYEKNKINHERQDNGY